MNHPGSLFLLLLLICMGCADHTTTAPRPPSSSEGEASAGPLALLRAVPRSLPGGTGGRLRLEGRGFTADSRIWFDGRELLGVDVLDPGALLAELPALNGGPGAKPIDIVAARQWVRNDRIFYLNAGQPALAAPSILNLSPGPLDTVAADVNSDGRDDLVILLAADYHAGPTQVAVLLSELGGRQLLHRTYDFAEHIVGLLVQDLDLDGKMDLLTLHVNTGIVEPEPLVLRTLRGDGTGGFFPVTQMSAVDLPRQFDRGSPPVLADLNHDGRADLLYLVWDRSGALLAMHTAKEGFTFAQARITRLPNSVDRFFVGRIDNRDDHPDLIAFSTNSIAVDSVFTLPGDGRGGIGAPKETRLPVTAYSGAPASLDRDPYTDLVVLGANRMLYPLVADGTGQFSIGTPLSVRQDTASWHMAHDINKDGLLDLVSFTSDSYVEVWNSDGKGGFIPGRKLAASYAAYKAIGDFDADGSPDLALSIFGNFGVGSRVIVLPDLAEQTTDRERFLPLASRVSALAAVQSGPGQRQDLIVGVRGTWGLGRLKNLGGGDFAALESFYALDLPTSLLPAAIRTHRGGPIDLVATDYYSGRAVAFFGLLTGGFRDTESESFDLQQGLRCAATGDFNRDGTVDLALGGSRQGVFLQLRSPHGVHPPFSTLSRDREISKLVSSDLDADGWLDLVATQRVPTGVAVWYGVGRPDTSPVPAEYAIGPAAEQLAVEDLNFDGYPDLIVGSGSWVGGVVIRLNDGRGGFLAPERYPAEQAGNGLSVADMDGDGTPDIVALGSIVTILFGDGTGHFPRRHAWFAGISPNSLAVADFDQDGMPDLAVGSSTAQGVTLLMNRSH